MVDWQKSNFENVIDLLLMDKWSTLFISVLTTNATHSSIAICRHLYSRSGSLTFYFGKAINMWCLEIKKLLSFIPTKLSFLFTGSAGQSNGWFAIRNLIDESIYCVVCLNYLNITNTIYVIQTPSTVLKLITLYIFLLFHLCLWKHFICRCDFIFSL